jgi:alkylhydroperoxidase/carboxymuconolactone decarboxylase family protein YurZ
MSPTVRFQETLRRLTIIDEAFVEGQAGLGFSLALASVLDAKTVALLRLGAAVAIGPPGICLEWSTGRALAAGATEDEIVDLLVAIAPVTGLSRVSAAAPEVAIALGYDVEAALEEPDGGG